jgi:hypothetical protein
MLTREIPRNHHFHENPVIFDEYMGHRRIRRNVKESKGISKGFEGLYRNLKQFQGF